jgi:omega-hydroxy-beta-dihydromenaquinone-9 sulfotransferase
VGSETTVRRGPQYVFVIGTGRCGSTLTEEILCRHPQVGFISNLDDRLQLPAGAARFNGWLYRRLPARVADNSLIKLLPSEAYRTLDREVSPILSSPFRDLDALDASPWLAGRLEEFFGGRAAAQKAGTFVHKFTGWPRAAFLHSVFPTARFINILRDGRAVANSWLQMPWWLGYGGPERWQWGPLPSGLAAKWDDSNRSFAVLAALLWQMLVDASDRARAAVPEDAWLEIRYEDVTADPHGTFDSVLRFCGLEWCDEFERGLARYRFHNSRVDAFRRDLDPAELARMTEGIASALEAHGYPVGAD